MSDRPVKVDVQGEGLITEGLGAPLRKVLEARDGQATIVRFANGNETVVHNVAWGRDIGDLWEHVTADCSPFIDGQDPGFFFMSEVASLIDPETGLVLMEQQPAPGER